MEKIKKYSSILTELVKNYQRSDNPIETHVIIDEKTRHYQVATTVITLIATA